MAVAPAEKVKIPGGSTQTPPPAGIAIPPTGAKPPASPPESTTNPTFTSPQIQTAADVKTSQAVAGNAPAPKIPSVPNASQTTPSLGAGGQPAPSNPQATEQQNTPSPKPSVSSPKAPAPTPTVSSASPATAPVPTVPTTTGAPPGVPLTTPTIGLPPTMKSAQGQNANEADYTQAQNEYNQKVYEAALAYNGGPDSALSAAQRAAEVQDRNATNARGAAGTIESSLYGEDKSKIATTQAVADEHAYNVYQEAMTTYQDALNKAQITYERGTEQEKREMAEAAEKLEPKEPINPPPNPPAVAPASNIPPGYTYDPKTGWVHGPNGTGYRLNKGQ